MTLSLGCHFCFSVKGPVFSALRLMKGECFVESFTSALLGHFVEKELEEI